MESSLNPVKLTSIFDLSHLFLDFDFDFDFGVGKIKLLTFDVWRSKTEKSKFLSQRRKIELQG